MDEKTKITFKIIELGKELAALLEKQKRENDDKEAVFFEVKANIHNKNMDSPADYQLLFVLK